jgi:hypothetical protein
MEGNRLLRIFSLFLFVAFVGCGSPINSSKNSNIPAINPNFGRDPLNPAEDDAPSEVAGMFMKVTSSNANITLHRADVQYQDGAFNRQDAGTTNLTTECRIASTATGNDADIFCIAEIEELDLFFNELTIQYHVPPSMCSYVRFIPYHYYTFEAGVGPTATSHEILADGTINDVLNTSNGEPQCSYKHPGGPNCCTGSYFQTVKQYAADGSFTQETTPAEWGGQMKNCLTGPALSQSWTEYIGSDGIPKARLEYVSGVGFNSTFKVLSALSQSFNQDIPYTGNIWGANFYNPSDHPAATGPGFVTAPLDGDRPVALRIPDNVSVADRYLPEDSYVLSCLDRADEVTRRIRLMIREWNDNPIASGGNPDDAGTDPGFPDDDLNDQYDWLDYGANYPASNI